MQQRLVCKGCSGKEFIDICNLDTSHWTPVSESVFSDKTKRSADYEHVLNMLDLDVKHDIVQYILKREKDTGRKYKNIEKFILDELYELDTTQVIKKLVKLRRHEEVEAHIDRKKEIELRVTIKRLEDRIRYDLYYCTYL